MAMAGEQRRMPVALDDLGADGSTRSPSAPGHRPRSPGSRWLYVPTGPEILPVSISSTAAARRRRPRSSSNAQPASLNPASSAPRGPSGCDPSSPCRPRPGRGSRSRRAGGPVERAIARRRRAAGAPGPCRRRRCWSARSAGSGPPARPISATWLTKAMTSWSVVRSISAMRSTSMRARVAMRGEGIGRDLAPSRLGAGHGQLHAEHRLEAGGVGPERAHLGERVARDHRVSTAAAGGCCAACRDADVVAALQAVRAGSRSAAREAASAAASTSGPRPTTVRTRPPAVRNVPSASRAVPAWNTSAPG